jgi:hypothetical protein
MCGWDSWEVPHEFWLEDRTPPSGWDVFRLANAVTCVVATERFVEAASSLEPSDVLFKELPPSEPREDGRATSIR